MFPFGTISLRRETHGPQCRVALYRIHASEKSVGSFATLALLLAGIGIDGVISYSVSQRMHEFGMRMAPGASSWNLMPMVIKQGVALAVIGTGLGLACALLFAGPWRICVRSER